MRRVVATLVVGGLLVILLVVATACGSSAAQPSPSPRAPRQLVSLNGFVLGAGQSYRVTFAVDAPTLRLVAYVKGPGPGAGRNPSLHCLLSRVGASGVTPVPMAVGGHAGKAYWLYAGQSDAPLQPGTYRLTITGDGRLQPLFVGQL